MHASLLASGGWWLSLVLLGMRPHPSDLSVFNGYLSCVSKFLLPPLIRTLVLGCRVHPKSRDDLVLRFLSTSTKTLFPTKVTFIGPRVSPWAYLFGEHYSGCVYLKQ